MPPAYLLDINVLLALGFAQHRSHALAVEHLAACEAEWATCSITQLGFIRIASIPAVFDQKLTPRNAQTILKSLCDNARHRYLADNPDVLRCDFSRLTGHRQTTDAYLIALARHHRLRLLTLDKRLANSHEGVDVELLQA